MSTPEAGLENHPENLPEFFGYFGRKFVPKRLDTPFPLWGYQPESPINLIDWQLGGLFSCHVQGDDQGGGWPCLVSPSAEWNGHFDRLCNSRFPLPLKGNRFLLGVESTPEGIMVSQILKGSPTIGKIECFFGGTLWVMGEKGIVKAASIDTRLYQSKEVGRFKAGTDLVVIPAISGVCGEVNGVILTMGEDIAPNSLGKDFLAEFFKGLVNPPVSQDSRGLPATYSNSDECLAPSRRVEPPRWVRLDNPRGLYSARRRK